MAEQSASTIGILHRADLRLPADMLGGADAMRPGLPHRGFVPRAGAPGPAAPIAAASDGENFDWGQPIDEPPPLIEPLFIGFDSDDVVEPPAAAADAGPADASELDDAPEPALADEPEEKPLPENARAWDEELLYDERIEARDKPEKTDAEISEPARVAPADETLPWWREPQEDGHSGTSMPPVGRPQEAAAARRDVRLHWLRLPLRLAVAALLVGLGAAGFRLYAGYGHGIPAQTMLAPLPEVPSDPAKRLVFYQTRAKAGDAEAQLELAIIYAKGEGVAQNYTTAAKWFRAAAEQGVPRAQYDLGVLYERGHGVPQNDAEAFRWYSRSAEANFPLAQYNLAVAYTRGAGTKQDFAAAAGWYRRAAIQGVVPAMVNLAVLYERGEGVMASAIEAYAWYRAAASRGNRPSSKRAAELYDILAQADRKRAEARAATVIAALPAATPEEAAAAPSPLAPPPKLKSGLAPGPEEEGGTSPGTTAVN